jgi:hypothetical protein
MKVMDPIGPAVFGRDATVLGASVPALVQLALWERSAFYIYAPSLRRKAERKSDR